MPGVVFLGQVSFDPVAAGVGDGFPDATEGVFGIFFEEVSANDDLVGDALGEVE